MLLYVGIVSFARDVIHEIGDAVKLVAAPPRAAALNANEGITFYEE